MDLKTTLTGGYSDRIKNNLDGVPERFAWKITFPSDLNIGAVAQSNIMILDDKLQKMNSAYEYNARENSIKLSPDDKYEPNRDYFFVIAKYKRNNRTRDLCVAFRLQEGNEIQTFDIKMSTQKIREANWRIKGIPPGTDGTQITKAVFKEYLVKLPFKFNMFFLYISMITMLIQFCIETFFDPVLFTSAGVNMHLSYYSTRVTIYTVIICSVLQVIVALRYAKGKKWESIKAYNRAVGLYNSGRFVRAFEIFERAAEINPGNRAADKALSLCEQFMLDITGDKVREVDDTDSLDPIDYSFNVIPLICAGVFNFLLVLFVHIMQVGWEPAQYLWELFWLCLIVQCVIFIYQYMGKTRKSVLLYNKGIEAFNEQTYDTAIEYFKESLANDKGNLSARSALDLTADKVRNSTKITKRKS